MNKQVGLSLSLCVRHILEGTIREEDVAFIVPGFKWDGTASEFYYTSYWKPWDRSAVDALIARLDIRDGRIGGHNIANGIWWPVDQWDDSVLDDPEKRIHTKNLNQRSAV